MSSLRGINVRHCWLQSIAAEPTIPLLKRVDSPILGQESYADRGSEIELFSNLMSNLCVCPPQRSRQKNRPSSYLQSNFDEIRRSAYSHNAMIIISFH